MNEQLSNIWNKLIEIDKAISSIRDEIVVIDNKEKQKLFEKAYTG